MFVELLMKKNGKIIFALFLILVVAASIFGGVLVYDAMNTDIYTFTKDGYALTFSAQNNTKAQAYSFKNGSEYQYKKNSNTINFEVEEEKVRLDENTIMHYSDGSLGVLKKVVGIDVSTVDRNIIFYYNIYKDTKITATTDGHSIKLKNDNEVKFKNLLMRISDNKFILTGKNVRLVLSSDNIVDFGEYVEFEYMDGNIVKIYNQDKFYQTISSESHLLVSDVKINLSKATISKGSKEFISLTNLVVNNDGNIDTLEEKIEKQEVYLEDGDIDVPTIQPPDTSIVEGDKDDETSGSIGDDEDKEEVVDKNKIEKTPSYKVSELIVSALKVEAKIEIIDADNLISTDTIVQIVENKTAKVIFEESGTRGDAEVNISCADLQPDTEYTIYARASYVIDGVEIERVFLSKIFRSEDLGVSFESSLLTDNSITVEVSKENYSKVNSVVMELYKDNGDKIDDRTLRFENGSVETVEFVGLTSNSEYVVKMTQISSQNVIVDEGYSVSKTIKTLKQKPTIGDLAYDIDKKNSAFNLSVTSVTDPDYGIQNYRYEVYFVEEDIMQDKPSVVVNKNVLETTPVKVDDVNLVRDRTYTYVLVVEFYDNEKIVEYSKNMGYTMSLTGFKYPTIKVDDENAALTWEKYESTLIIEDPDSVIQSDEFIVTYKNSIDISTTRVVTSGKNAYDQYTIPISVNGLRASDTYTFQVTGKIDLGDGNGPVNAYIGSVYVQTGEPQPLKANIAQASDQTQAFSLRVALSDPEGLDSSYEAKTLTKITFELYRGENAEGEPFKSRTIYDTEEAPYESTLKDQLYDRDGITITPDTFNAEKSEFTEQKYTLVVTKAYDYTKHPNEIPIEEGKFTFNLNAVLPTIPEKPRDAVYITEITNKNANDFGLSKDLELDNTTTLAYALTPQFNNESSTARKIRWEVYMFDITKGDWVVVPSLSKVQTVPEDTEELPYTIFEISSGTSQETIDMDALRRGNKYYFRYTIELNIEGEEIIYPDNPLFNNTGEPIILTTRDISTVKQSAKVEIYPSYSDVNADGTYKYVWNYRIYDIDHALVENENGLPELYLYEEGKGDATSKGEVNATYVLASGNINDLDFSRVVFNGITGDNMIMLQKSERLNKLSVAENTLLLTEYFSKIQEFEEIKYSITTETNRLVINFDNSPENQAILNSVASVNVIVKPVDSGVSPSELRFNGQMISGNSISIDFLSIQDYIGKYIKVELEVYYDTGRTGFDVISQFGGYAAVQQVPKSVIDKTYYRIGGDGLISSTSLNGSMFKSALSFDQSGNHTLTLTPYSGGSKRVAIKLAKSGVQYNKNYITLKQLAIYEISSEEQLKFNTIIPGISVLDSNGQIAITGLLTEATIKAKIIEAAASQINGNIEVEIRNIDDGTSPEIHEFTIEQLANQVTIPGLTPDKKYGVKFFAYVSDPTSPTGFKRYQLYDVDQYSNTIEYTFITIKEVTIKNIRASFTEKSYADKTLTVSFSPSIVYGYKGIDYELLDSSGKVIKSGTNTVLTTTMSIQISASPSASQTIKYGEDYTIRLRPYTQEGDDESTKKHLNTAEASISVPTAQQPTVGIRASKTDTTISFTVSVSDLDFVIINGKYDYVLKDSKGAIVATTIGTTNQQLTSKKNVTFSFNATDNGLKDGETYTFSVISKLDLTNTAKEEEYRLSKSIVYGSSLNLGSITASKNASNAYSIDLVFQDSYKLMETVASMQFTVTNYDNEFSYSSNLNFNNTTVVYNPSTKLYYVTITIPTEETGFTINNIYIIGLNFYNANGALEAQSEVTYYYS